jgi:ferritin-like metal-binding protein YciE
MASKEKIREGPVGVEIVRKGDKTILNVFVNGLVSSSHVMEHTEITMPEALAWLATQLRMGDLKI